MLYYEDTKLRRRKGVARTDVNKYLEITAKRLANRRVWQNIVAFSIIWQVTRPSTIIFSLRVVTSLKVSIAPIKASETPYVYYIRFS